MNHGDGLRRRVVPARDRHHGHHRQDRAQPEHRESIASQHDRGTPLKVPGTSPSLTLLGITRETQRRIGATEGASWPESVGRFSATLAQFRPANPHATAAPSAQTSF
jgi:hypothetical protein